MRRRLHIWRWRFFTTNRRRRIVLGLQEIDEYYTHYR